MDVEIQGRAVHETDFIARSKHVVCEIDMQYGVKINPKATFNTPASITCQTAGTTLDTQNRSAAWKAKVWHSVGVASRDHSLCLTTMPSSGFQNSLGGQNPSRKSGVITLFWPHRHLPSLIHQDRDTQAAIPTVQNTHTYVTERESLTSRSIYCLVAYSHRSRWGQRLLRFNATNQTNRGIHIGKAFLCHIECWGMPTGGPMGQWYYSVILIIYK